MISRILDTLIATTILTFAVILAHASKETPVIGFSIDDLCVEHWTHDCDYSVESTKKLGATVSMRSANANEAKQIAQIENLITQDVDVLVIVPFDSKVLGSAIASVRKKDIRMVSYDRLILNADIDGYVIFDNVKVSKLQAQGVIKLAPKGNYFLLGGATTNNDARLLCESQTKVLELYTDRGDIKIADEQWTPKWNPSEAQNIVENALTANNNNIQGIVASNNDTTGDTVQALVHQKLADKVPVSDQDADLATVKRVAEGTQAITVYRPIKQIVVTAAEMAADLAKGTAPKFNTKLNNGKKDVGTMLLTPTLLTRDNLDSTIVKDGFYAHQQTFGK